MMQIAQAKSSANCARAFKPKRLTQDGFKRYWLHDIWLPVCFKDKVGAHGYFFYNPKVRLVFLRKRSSNLACTYENNIKMCSTNILVKKVSGKKEISIRTDTFCSVRNITAPASARMAMGTVDAHMCATAVVLSAGVRTQ